MSDWDSAELARLDRADELNISSRRADGSLRGFVPIWMVAVDGDLYVRSARGPNGWYRRALASGSGRVRAGGVERDVTFTDAPDAPHAAIDAAYFRKYKRYGDSMVGHVTGDWMRELTVRIDPA